MTLPLALVLFCCAGMQSPVDNAGTIPAAPWAQCSTKGIGSPIDCTPQAAESADRPKIPSRKYADSPLATLSPGLTAPHSSLVTPVSSEERRPAENKRLWLALSAAQHSAAGFDAWSTRRSIQSGNGHEANPLVAPFANSAAVYPALQIVPLGFDFLARRMIRSSHRPIRQMWWLPQAACTSISVWSGIHNLNIANLSKR